MRSGVFRRSSSVSESLEQLERSSFGTSEAVSAVLMELGVALPVNTCRLVNRGIVVGAMGACRALGCACGVGSLGALGAFKGAPLLCGGGSHDDDEAGMACPGA